MSDRSPDGSPDRGDAFARRPITAPQDLAQPDDLARQRAIENLKSITVDRVSTARSTLEETVELIDRETQADRDRSWIARLIIWIFVGAIAAAFIMLVAQGYWTGQWQAASVQAVDLIKSAVIPVVTLVLGFYFGSRPGKG